MTTGHQLSPAARQDFVIVVGWAAVTVDGEPVAAFGPGQFAGEMALLDGQAPSATVVAKTDRVHNEGD